MGNCCGCCCNEDRKQQAINDLQDRIKDLETKKNPNQEEDSNITQIHKDLRTSIKRLKETKGDTKELKLLSKKVAELEKAAKLSDGNQTVQETDEIVKRLSTDENFKNLIVQALQETKGQIPEKPAAQATDEIVKRLSCDENFQSLVGEKVKIEMNERNSASVKITHGKDHDDEPSVSYRPAESGAKERGPLGKRRAVKSMYGHQNTSGIQILLLCTHENYLDTAKSVIETVKASSGERFEIKAKILKGQSAFSKDDLQGVKKVVLVAVEESAGPIISKTETSQLGQCYNTVINDKASALVLYMFEDETKKSRKGRLYSVSLKDMLSSEPALEELAEKEMFLSLKYKKETKGFNDKQKRAFIQWVKSQKC